MSISGWVFFAVVIVAVFFLISIFNQLVALKNQFANAFSQIDVQLKRRYDLIPNLVETAKAYMSHERETLEAVIAARNNAASGLKSASTTGDGGMNNLSVAEAQLGSAMSRFNVVVEQYPDLKADTQIRNRWCQPEPKRCQVGHPKKKAQLLLGKPKTFFHYLKRVPF